MSRVSCPSKVQEWVDRLDRFAAGSVSVSAFCKAEGVSQPSYYYWRAKLQGSSSADPLAGGRFRAVRISPGVTEPSERTTIQLGHGMRIELGTDLSVAGLIVERVLDVVGDRNGQTTARKGK